MIVGSSLDKIVRRADNCTYIEETHFQISAKLRYSKIQYKENFMFLPCHDENKQ